MSTKPLGRGLNALLGNTSSSPAQAGVQKVALNLLKPCPFQPRKHFSPESLQELAASIRERGILQPLLVRRQGDHYEIIAGERRWRAAQLTELSEVPIILKSSTDGELVELALIENLQRQDLNPIEEAEGYYQLQTHHHLTQDEIAQKVGKARASVANALRLLELQPTVKNLVSQSLLSSGHAKVLLGVKDRPLQKQLADRIIKEGLSVREAEALVQGLGQVKRSKTRSNNKSSLSSQPPYLQEIETRLRQHLTTNVRIYHNPDKKGKGRIEIDYYNPDDLNRLIEIIGLKSD